MAAEAKKDAIHAQRDAQGTVKSLRQRISFLEHRAAQEVEARERAVKESFDKALMVRV